MKSFDNRSVGSATNKSSSVKHQSRHASADGLRRSANRQPSIGKNHERFDFHLKLEFLRKVASEFEKALLT